MNESELRALLRQVADRHQPPDDFVSSLWSDLELKATANPEAGHRVELISEQVSAASSHQVVDLTTRTSDERVRSGPIVSLVAAAAALLIGLFAILIQAFSGPGLIASPHIEPTQQGAAVVVDEVPATDNTSQLVRTCDRLLVETRVAAVLRPGVVTGATSHGPSALIETDVTAIELRSVVLAIEQLSDSSEIQSDVRLRHGLTSATGALDQAILLVEMGEPGLAHERIDQAKLALGEIASEPALDGCLESVS